MTFEAIVRRVSCPCARCSAAKSISLALGVSFVGIHEQRRARTISELLGLR